jgi:hypothetical protein
MLLPGRAPDGLVAMLRCAGAGRRIPEAVDGWQARRPS